MTDYVARIQAVAEAARAERAAFDAPDEPEDRAMTYCREGVGEVAAIYCEARTNGGYDDIPHEARETLRTALNDWLELYARCYGVEMDASFAVVEAAELLVQTHNARDVAQLLTTVPERRTAARGD